MRLFIANCTFQNHVVNCGQPPEMGKNLSRMVRAGRQELIGDLADVQIDAIVRYLEPYGLATPEAALRSRKVTSLIYSLGSPVKAEQIRKVVDYNASVKREEGKQRRQAAAVAAASESDKMAPTNVFEMSVEEVKSAQALEAGAQAIDGDPIAEGIRVVKSAPDGGSAPRRTRRAA